MVIPRCRSSGALSISSIFSNRTLLPARLRTCKIAAVSDVLPWSTCPIVPTLTWGFVRSNFSAIGVQKLKPNKKRLEANMVLVYIKPKMVSTPPPNRQANKKRGLCPSISHLSAIRALRKIHFAKPRNKIVKIIWMRVLHWIIFVCVLRRVTNDAKPQTHNGRNRKMLCGQLWQIQHVLYFGLHFFYP